MKSDCAPLLSSPLSLAFVPTFSRHDFLKQIYRYMIIAYQDNGLAAYGKRMTIDLVDGTVSGKSSQHLSSPTIATR